MVMRLVFATPALIVKWMINHRKQCWSCIYFMLNFSTALHAPRESFLTSERKVYNAKRFNNTNGIRQEEHLEDRAALQYQKVSFKSECAMVDVH